jgi:hypothetical protein
MKHLCIAVVAGMLGVIYASAADQTWTGKISDSMCGTKHNAAAERAGKKMSDRDCTLACVKEHNAKHVFVSGDKVYNVSNQDFAALQEHAGHTGEIDVRNEWRPDYGFQNRNARHQEEKLNPTVANEAHTEAS